MIISLSKRFDAMGFVKIWALYFETLVSYS